MESINFSTYYRPKTFSEVVGQDTAVAVLKRIAMADGISVRSIFLKGAYGSGKSTLARIFGRALSCEQFKKTGEVCNECASCKEALAKNSQLYLEFDSSVVGNVERIRDLQQQLSYVPSKGRRLVVFDEIHAASNAAQNAMLKMIEEGIPNTIFLFASTDEIIPTIKSRSICLDISTIPFDKIKQRVLEVANNQNIEVDGQILDTIAMKSGGHMRDALSLLQLYSLAGTDGLKTSYQLVVNFFVKALQSKVDEANEILREILSYNTVDIRNSINLFIRNTYCADANSPLYKLQQTGVINKIFAFIFTPANQLALRDEVGIEIVFKSFLDKVKAK